MLEATPTRQTVEIHITYFKDTGKFYTAAVYPMEVELINGTIVPMFKVSQHLKQLRQQSQLPGLVGGWDSFILIDAENGYPCLMLPGGE
jgi:hypothetical protein